MVKEAKGCHNELLLARFKAKLTVRVVKTISHVVVVVI